MSIYEGLSQPTRENVNYGLKTSDDIDGHMKYAVLNKETSGLKGMKNKLMELIAPINPFHLRQHAHPLGYNVTGVRDGSYFAGFMDYPFVHKFDFGKPNHYDPTKDVEGPHPDEHPYTYLSQGRNKIIQIVPEKVPYVCEVQKKKLDICKLVNDKSKCTKESQDFLEICPNFALRTYRNNKLFNEKAKIIQRKEYNEAMKVGEYNRNRTIADVSKKSNYSLGMASFLRPDSMWADDRYINITQKDVDAAREKLSSKYKDFDYKDIKGYHKHHTNEATYSHPPRIY